MAKWGKCDFKELEKFRDRIEEFSEYGVDRFCEDVTKELAARLLAQVIRRTPVGDYTGDAYITKSGRKSHRRYKTVSFSTNSGKNVSFKASTAGKKGGTLRRGWTTQKNGSGSEGLGANNAKAFVDTLKIHHYGSYYIIEIVNAVEYASYVEYGHRKRGGKGWVNGRFMLTNSEKIISGQAQAIIERKLKVYLKEVFK